MVSMRDLVGRVFFALQDTRTPLMLGLATVGINVVGNLLLVGPLEQGGLALATTIANGFGLVGGILWLHKKVPGGLPTARVAVSVTRTWLSSAVMGLVLFVLSTFMLMSAGPMNTLTFLARALEVL